MGIFLSLFLGCLLLFGELALGSPPSLTCEGLEPCPPISKPPAPKVIPWEEEYERIFSEKERPKKEPPSPEVSRRKKSAQVGRKRHFAEWYLFADAESVEGMKPCGGCRREGGYLMGRLGFRFAWQVADFLSLWGDFRGGLGYQDFMEDHRKKGWFDVRYFYLSTKSIYDPKFPGFYFSLGRIPLTEKRAFWYYNYLDGLRLGYQSTLLKWFLFLGKRLEDKRLSTNEERVNIKGYFYILGRIDYQYFYRKHLSLFYLKEKKNDFSNTGSPTVWEGVRPKKDLNWLGLRLTGEKGRGIKKWDYWIDLAYLWGYRGFAETNFIGCSAKKAVERTFYPKMEGFGGEIGLRMVRGKFGWGGRIALGEGSDRREERKNFFLPKISNSRAHLLGPNRLRYYGELSNPDLNNLLLLSLFGGYEVYPENWLEINLIKYHQLKASPYTPFSRYFVGANGKHKDLGWEMDLIFDGQLKRTLSKWRYLIIGSVFFPGRAFSDTACDEPLFGLFIKIKRYW